MEVEEGGGEGGREGHTNQEGGGVQVTKDRLQGFEGMEAEREGAGGSEGWKVVPHMEEQAIGAFHLSA